MLPVSGRGLLVSEPDSLTSTQVPRTTCLRARCPVLPCRRRLVDKDRVSSRRGGPDRLPV